MLHHASRKISIWAQVVLYAGIALSVIAGFIIIWNNAQLPAVRYTYYHMGAFYQAGYTHGGMAVIGGFLVMIFGSLLSWLLALLLKAFGELTADTRAIREQMEDVFCETADGEPVYTQEAEPVYTQPAKVVDTKEETANAETADAGETPVESASDDSAQS